MPKAQRLNLKGAAMACHDPLLSRHDVYLHLASDDDPRRARYRERVAQGLGEEELYASRLCAQRQRALGSDCFQRAIERRLTQRAGLGLPGRPKKCVAENVL